MQSAVGAAQMHCENGVLSAGAASLRFPPICPARLLRRVPAVRTFRRFRICTSLPSSPERPDDAHSNEPRDLYDDDMLDDLFKKYGKTVYRSGDRKPTGAEADDDSESLSFAVALAKVANDVKAADIRVLFVKPLVYWTRFFIIVTAFSRPQIDAIGSRIRDIAEKQFNKVASGDTRPNSWTLLDFGDVVVHIFLPQHRAFYNLEEFYGNATPIELPFESESAFSKMPFGQVKENHMLEH